MKTIALYDGTCSLCRKSKRIFEKLDWLGKVYWVSLQEYEKTAQSQVVLFDQMELRKELHIITSSGKVLKGYYAIRHILVLFPSTILMGVILFIPFSPLIGNPIYKWIAKNRHKFLKRKCEDGSCSL
ncbi:DUF393 domain-containing protein [Bacillus sp. FJAT-29790]|uniref:thiol-disulfide oxidoreductase DCC family protein n=1 Tax=Bacillus sp. FJAT-29790 TaxID=1895002 RepID=UPI001C214880|nr:DUF393 domain-containing protein [Bacillus sp. FJAT-29790]MBU8879837.1 DUF393 domain-containing protein [Bacillus sp. FJAT-29790]